MNSVGSQRAPLGWLRRLALGISPRETSFARRGFRNLSSPARPHLERVGETFVAGYLAALRRGEPDPAGQLAELDALSPELVGFAMEGAAMAYALLDLLTPWNRGRVQRWLAGTGQRHAYMIHVGAGWALARLRRRPGRALRRMDPLLRWLAVDGYGFHEGYFGWPRAIARQLVPRRLQGYERRAFDQGLGRSLWFVEGADGERIAAAVARFAPERHADLWSGVGLAGTYAGGVGRAELLGVRGLAGAHAAALAQGAAFAAQARARAGNPARHTELACEVWCGSSASEAAGLTNAVLAGITGDVEHRYENWRQGIQAAYRGGDAC